MPDNSELDNLFKGLLDESPLSDTEDENVKIITPMKQSKYNIGSNWETKPINSLCEQNDLSSEGADMVAKRDYEDMPPDAIDAAGKPKKKVRVIDLEKYEAVDRTGDREESLPSPVARVTNEGEMQPRKSDTSMDIDQTGSTQHEDRELMNINARMAVGNETVQPDGTDQSCHKAREIGSDQKPPPGSQTNQNFLSPLEHQTGENNDQCMDTMEAVGVEPKSANSNHISSHKLDKAIMLKPSADAGFVMEPETNINDDEGIMDMIKEAVQIGITDSDDPKAQNLGEKTIPKPGIKPVLPRHSELDVNCELEDDLEYNQQDNIRRPKYKSTLPVRKGYVLWWSNVLGKGQISERHTNEVRTVHWWQLKPHYGALHSGVSVEYQWEYGNYQKFWVVRGMPYVL